MAYISLSLLMPRPIMVPLLVWLLWRRPHVRRIALAIGIAHVALILASGWGEAWIGRMASTGSNMLSSPWNIGPSSAMGIWWLAAGVPLGAWLVWRDRVGFASLAIAPYWLPYYFLMLLMEVERWWRPSNPK